MSTFRDTLAAHAAAVQSLSPLEPRLLALANDVTSALRDGHKLLLFGNGGSAGDAQHIAAELTGRYERERKGLAAIALTTDSSALTAIANDYGFDRVFARQVDALAQPGDVLLGISTSGNSSNVLAALEEGQARGCVNWGLAGRDGGAMAERLGERILVVPAKSTARVQECHILLGHLLCDLVEEALTP
ncbi:MAG: D-sedoheptulose 7-phosphate isomerase [Myxococcota bacterium]